MDTDTLVDCGIDKNSTIDLNVLQYDEKLKISIKELTLDETIHIVEAKLNDTVKNIKKMIADSKGYEYERLTLMFEGKLLKDDSTLESLQVEDDSTFDLVLCAKQEISINVKEPKGDIFQLDVKTCFSVLHVKALVGRKTGKPLIDWHLLFHRNLLKECRTLAYYAIVNGSILNIYYRKIPILVKTWTGESIVLSVEQDQRVSDLKLKVIQKMRMRKMPRPSRITKLEYEGKELEDGEKLSSYNIKQDSTIVEH
ncbi:hypothetical protein L6164_012922 [Bauhinia variegata]|nr:hypothetical protein L6164_012922 [Bauhinia variegata]